MGIILPEKTLDILLQLRFETVYGFEHGDWRQARIVRNGVDLRARVRVKSNHSQQRESKEYGGGQRTGHSHRQKEI